MWKPTLFALCLQGAIITDRILNEDVTTKYSVPNPYVSLSFSPLAHSERVNVLCSIMNGGRTGIFGHVSNLLSLS